MIEVWRAREKGERQNRAKYRERGRRERHRIEQSMESKGEGKERQSSEV